MRSPLPLAVLCLAAALALPAAAAAQSKDAKVTIKIKRNPYRLQVVPRGVGVCKQGTDDCDVSVLWQTGNGSNGPRANEYLLITHKPGPCGAASCFGGTEFRLDQTYSQVGSGPVTAACQTPTAWFYQVDLYVDGKVEATLDPGVIIDAGGTWP